jgi:hypothetical protein
MLVRQVLYCLNHSSSPPLQTFVHSVSLPHLQISVLPGICIRYTSYVLFCCYLLTVVISHWTEIAYAFAHHKTKTVHYCIFNSYPCVTHSRYPGHVLFCWVFVLVVLWVKSRASQMLSNCSTTELPVFWIKEWEIRQAWWHMPVIQVLRRLK